MFADILGHEDRNFLKINSEALMALLYNYANSNYISNVRIVLEYLQYIQPNHAVRICEVSKLS